MKKTMNVYVVGNDHLVSGMFHVREGFTLVDEYTMADIVVFTGGADVYPALYGHKVHRTTGYDIARDDYEQKLFHSIDDTTLRVGICRGGQFLNVMNGGVMWQDVDNHAVYKGHILVYHDEKGNARKMHVTSTHHQMMKPGHEGQTNPYEIWGVAQLSTHRDLGNEIKKPSDFEKDGLDNEIVWYPKTNSLCFQPHPEYKSESCRELFFECIERAMNARGMAEAA